MTLTEFLLARIAEDEAAAVAEIPTGPRRNGKTFWRRTLVGCEARRQIVYRTTKPIAHAGQDIERQAVVRLLALPYSDHPDYDEEWKP